MREQGISFWDSNSHQNDKCLISYDFPKTGVFSFSYREKSWPENCYLFWSIDQNGTQSGWFGSLKRIEFSFAKSGDQDWQIKSPFYVTQHMFSQSVEASIEMSLNQAFSFIGSLLRPKAEEFLQ